MFVYEIVYINLLNTKRNLLYIRNQSVPRCKHFLSGYKKTHHIMRDKANASVHSEIRTKHSTQSEHNIEFLNVQSGGTSRNR